MNLILDASVAGKWLVPEPDSEKAAAILAGWERGEVSVLAPETLTLEISSLLWKRVRRGLLPEDRAILLFDRFNRLGILQVSIQEIIETAFRWALALQHSVYDGLYVALAMQTGWDFVTADERLFNLLLPEFPQVRLLRDWR